MTQIRDTSCELVEQGLGLDEIARVEAFGEPREERGQEGAGCVALLPVAARAAPGWSRRDFMTFASCSLAIAIARLEVRLSPTCCAASALQDEPPR